MSIESKVAELSKLLAGLHIAERERALELIADLVTEEPLTGLHNRRGLSSKLDEELARARRYGRPLSALMIDVDDFKRYNDVYGHLQGDEALKYVSELLQSQRRVMDIAARYGGEEFLLLLPETNEEGATHIARNLLERTVSRKLDRYVGEPDARDKKYIDEKGYGNITISIGISSFPNTTKEPQFLLTDADRALYDAKAAGKNTFRVFRTPKLTRPPNPSG